MQPKKVCHTERSLKAVVVKVEFRYFLRMCVHFHLGLYNAGNCMKLSGSGGV